MLVDNQGMGIYVMSTKLSRKIQIVLYTGNFFYMLRLGFSMKVKGWCFLVYLFSCFLIITKLLTYYLRVCKSFKSHLLDG